MDTYVLQYTQDIRSKQSVRNTGSWFARAVASRFTENPADILSQGATVDELKNRDLWWHGPKWRGGTWPEQPESVIELSEKKTTIHLVAITELSNVLPDVSSFIRLCRIVAYCCRFVKKCRKEAPAGLTLTVPELEQAEIIVIKLV